MKLWLSERQILINQEFEVLAEVVSMAFGSGNSAENEVTPTSGAEAILEFKKMFGA